MKLPDKVYNIVKYVLCIAIPAINVALLALGNLYGWSWADVATQTLVIIQTLLAALFSISIAGYKKEDAVKVTTEEK